MFYILVNLPTFKGIWGSLITLKDILVDLLYVNSNIEGRIQGIVLT